MFWAPDAAQPVPLLVGLHTWSGDYAQTGDTFGRPYAEWCIERGWAFIQPNFRGPNRRPEACGSELAVGDIVSAVRHAEERVAIDPERIYLVGVSGGGYMALLMAGRYPKLWAGVSAWVPITQLADWHAECRRAGRHYADDLEAVCGGPPGASERVDREYRHRSPATWLTAAVGVPIDINAGIRDGHEGSVPISHSLRAFNLLAEKNERLSEEDIEAMLRTASVPESLGKSPEDPLYGERRPLFRRVSGAARVTIFRGGHEIVPQAALHWLEQQRRPQWAPFAIDPAAVDEG